MAVRDGGRERERERKGTGGLHLHIYMLAATVSYQSCTDSYTLSALYCMAHDDVS